MQAIIKILQAYKSGKITEKELTILLNIKRRKKLHLFKNELAECYQVWGDDICMLSSEKKEEAEGFISKANDLLNTCLEETK